MTPPPGHGEHELVSVLAYDSRRELGGEEPGQRDGAGLVRFRGTQDDPAAHVGEGTADTDTAAIEVDTGPAVVPGDPA
jgi:hypothetical protein